MIQMDTDSTQSEGIYMTLMDRLLLSVQLCSMKESAEHLSNCIPQEIRAVIRREALEEAALYADKHNAGIGGGIRALKKNR